MAANSTKALEGLKEVISYIHAYDVDEVTKNFEGLLSEHTSTIDKN